MVSSLQTQPGSRAPPSSDQVGVGTGPQPQGARQASCGVGLTAPGQQAKQKGRAAGPLGKLNFIPSPLFNSPGLPCQPFSRG